MRSTASLPLDAEFEGRNALLRVRQIERRVWSASVKRLDLNAVRCRTIPDPRLPGVA